METLSVRPAQAAAMSGLSRSLLYEAMATGELPSIRVRAARLILVDDLRAWLESHRIGQEQSHG